jgi:hypothetical protein
MTLLYNINITELTFYRGCLYMCIYNIIISKYFHTQKTNKQTKNKATTTINKTFHFELRYNLSPLTQIHIIHYIKHSTDISNSAYLNKIIQLRNTALEGQRHFGVHFIPKYVTQVYNICLF